MGLFLHVCRFEHLSYKQIISIFKFQFLWKLATDWYERFDLFMRTIFTCLWTNRMNLTRYLPVMELIVCISDIMKFQSLALVMLSCHLIYYGILYLYMQIPRVQQEIKVLNFFQFCVICADFLRLIIQIWIGVIICSKCCAFNIEQMMKIIKDGDSLPKTVEHYSSKKPELFEDHSTEFI